MPKRNPFYYRKVPLFKAFKYFNEPAYKETYIVLGVEENSYYNLKIYANGYMRPYYNLPVAGAVYMIDDFNYGIIISQLFENKMDFRFIDVLKNIGKDDRKNDS